MTKAENLQNTAYMLQKRKDMMLEQARQEGEIPASVEKYLELMNQESFAKEFANCASEEAVKELFDRNGIDFTAEEIDAILIGIGTMMQKLEENDGELSEEDLEMVAGGWSWKNFLTGVVAGLVGGIIMTAACVAAIVAVGATGGVATPLVIAGAAKAIAVGAAVGTAVGAAVGAALGVAYD
jgi:hypothetical protein